MGGHPKQSKMIGAYRGVSTRALVAMICERTGKTLSKMIDEKIIEEAYAAGITDEKGIVLPSVRAAFDLVVDYVKMKDDENRGTRTKKGGKK